MRADQTDVILITSRNDSAYSGLYQQLCCQRRTLWHAPVDSSSHHDRHHGYAPRQVRPRRSTMHTSTFRATAHATPSR